jgi:hypothetical protein
MRHGTAEDHFGRRPPVNTTTSRQLVAPILAIGGGVVLGMGSFATWVTISGPEGGGYSEVGTEIGER